MSEKLEASAKQYEIISEELSKAAAHFKTAASHMRNKEIPRGIAHSFAGWGHVNKAEVTLKFESIVHAESSIP